MFNHVRSLGLRGKYKIYYLLLLFWAKIKAALELFEIVDQRAESAVTQP